MKIVYVIHDFFPRFFAGTERYVLNLAHQMQRMGHSVTVLAYGLEDPLENYQHYKDDIYFRRYTYKSIQVLSVRHKTVPSDIGLTIHDAAMEQLIAHMLRDKSFDLMHIAHPMRMGSAYAAAKKLKIPVVMTLTDFWLLCPKIRLFKTDYSLCNSPEKGKKCLRECAIESSVTKRYSEAYALFSGADAVISPSRFLIGIFENVGWKRDVVHINHGVDYHFVCPDTERLSDGTKVRFGFAGIVAKFKGVSLLLEAFRRVRADSIELKLFGNFEWEQEFDKEVQEALKSDSRIQLMGRYCHEDLPGLMDSVDVMVVPSNTLESYGLVVTESLSYGNPVIASDIVGSAYEYIRHDENGFIFPLHQPEKLYSIIELISHDPTILQRWRKNITLPGRLEEEAFQVESVYNKLIP